MHQQLLFAQFAQIFSGLHRSQGLLPRAIELDGDGSEVFMLDALSAGDTITLGKGLKQGRAWVEVSGTLHRPRITVRSTVSQRA